MSFVTPLTVAARTGLAAMRANTVRALRATTTASTPGPNRSSSSCSAAC
jgi:hypothetical protein